MERREGERSNAESIGSTNGIGGRPNASRPSVPWRQSALMEAITSRALANKTVPFSY
jgi:hypothetical protein